MSENQAGNTPGEPGTPHLSPDDRTLSRVSSPAPQAPSANIPEDTNAFVKEWVDLFLMNGKSSDEDLWEWFREEFEGWTRETFSGLDRDVRKSLKDGLRRNGVFVGGRQYLADQLFDTLTEPIQASWSSEEVRKEEIIAAKAKVNWNSQWSAKMVAWLKNHQQEMEAENRRIDEKIRLSAQPQGPPLLQPQVVIPSIEGPVQQNLRNGSAQPLYHQPHYPRPLSQQPQQPQLQRPRPGEKSSPNPHRDQTVMSNRFPIAIPRPLPQNNSHPSEAGRAITTLMKIYDDRSKYHGSSDILDTKLKIFYDLCAKAGVQEEDMGYAFSSMLAGDAKEFYYENVMNQDMAFPDMVLQLRTNFETKEHATKFMSHWNTTSLNEVRMRNADKTLLECFDILYQELRKCQLTMEPDQQKESFMTTRLLMAVNGVEECKMAIFKPPETLQGLRDDIRHALSLSSPPRASIFTTEPPPEDQIDSFIVDRKYYDNSKKHAGLSAKKCLVCDKMGCWSSNHSKEDQRVAFDRLAQSKGFPQRMRKFITEYEGIPTGSTLSYDSLIDTLPIDDPTPEDEKQEDLFYASYGIQDASEVFLQLAKQAVFHAVSRTHRIRPIIPKLQMPMASFMARYSEDKFAGILIDTGAASRSTVGLNQFKALRRFQKVNLDTARAGEARITFGIGEAVSIGTAAVKTLLGMVDFHVVPADVPFLLCLADLDRLRATYNNLKDTVFQEGGLQVPVFRMSGHPWMLLDPVKNLVSQDEEIFPTAECHLTKTELRQLHRRFGHPSVARLEKVLQRAEQDWDSAELQKITEFCKQCQIHGKSPGRFKFTLRDDKDFNHSVYTDVLYIDGKPVLHTVDESTSFQAAYFLKNLTAEHTWEALRASWIDVYLGPPTLIIHDPGTNFSSDEFRGNAHLMGIDVKETPTEAHNSVGLVERYHVPLRRAFDIISKEMPELAKETRLQMAVKAVNDTAGPDGLTPTLLVFGAFPRMSREDKPTSSTTQRAATIRKAMAEVRRCHSARQISDALRMRNGPNISAILTLPLNSDVLVWREKEPYWSGPYKLVAIDGYTCKVQVNNKVVDFRVTSVRPYKSDEKEELPEGNIPNSSPSKAPLIPREPLSNNEHPRRPPPVVEIPSLRINPDEYASFPDTAYTTAFMTAIFLSEKEKQDKDVAVELRRQGAITTPGAPFQESGWQEITSLLGKGVFRLVSIDHVPKGTQIYGSRLVNEVKGKETSSPYEKSRLVIQAFNDKGKMSILTASPTIQRMSQRAILAVAPSLLEQGFFVKIRDITQAYPQSTTNLTRLVYARPPKEIVSELPPGTILWVVIPLYGIPEAGLHWYGTYRTHHRVRLGMEQSTYDPCLMVTKDPRGPIGIVGLQTDDTLILGNQQFVDLEDEQLKEAGLVAKPAQTLTFDSPLAFNGCKLTVDVDGTISAIPKDQGKRLDLVDPSSTTAKQSYLEQRARGAYIATICQPEAAFDLSVAAQFQNPGTDEIKALNKRLQWQIENQERGLRFISD